MLEKKLETIAREKDVWNNLLGLLPQQHDPGYVEDNGWMINAIGNLGARCH